MAFFELVFFTGGQRLSGSPHSWASLVAVGSTQCLQCIGLLQGFQQHGADTGFKLLPTTMLSNDLLRCSGVFFKNYVANFMCFQHLFQRAELTSDKDLYLDNSSIEEASGVYPIDDDDYTSGSGSGNFIVY